MGRLGALYLGFTWPLHPLVLYMGALVAFEVPSIPTLAGLIFAFGFNDKMVPNSISMPDAPINYSMPWKVHERISV